MKKLIIIGANNFQLPVILKAKEMNIETHVFAWEEGAVGKGVASKFYPISITEKEQILAEARKIEPDGIISIGSDLAMITVNYVANELGLTANSATCTEVTTNKFLMRQVLDVSDMPCPKFILSNSSEEILNCGLKFPMIVKPTDRSGSRGVTKVQTHDELESAIKRAKSESFNQEVIVEEFVVGQEFSVESVSWKGEHYVLQITEKETTGAPYFVEKAQHQPANISTELQQEVAEIVKASLSALGVQDGASHSEIFITSENKIFITEIGARMGGDYIGSNLVELSTGFDFLKAVIEIAMGNFDPKSIRLDQNAYSGVYFIFPKPGKITQIINNSSDFAEIVQCDIQCAIGENISEIKESGKRPAAYIYRSETERFVAQSTVVEIVTEG